MKQIITLVLVAALGTSACTPLLPAPMMIPRPIPVVPLGPLGLWADVVALPRGTPVRVFTSGSRYDGTMLGADDTVLRLRTKTGAVVMDAARVLRVDRRQTVGGRLKRLLVSTAVRTAVLVLGTTAVISLVCHEATGEACLVLPSPTGVAAAAVALGTAEALSDDGPPLAVYVR